MVDTLFTTSSGTTRAETIREDYEGRITIMTPQDTPVQMLLGVRDVQSIDYDWNIDEIETPTDVQADVENKAFTAMVSDDAWGMVRQRRLTNTVMIAYKPIQVSRSTRWQDEAGVEDQFAYQAAKRMLGLAKQWDFNMHWSKWAARGTGSTAGKTAGLIQWAFETGFGRTQEDDVTIAGKTIPWELGSTWYENASGSKLSEAEFLENILQEHWRIGGDLSASVLLCGGKVKALLSEFGVVYTQGSETDENLGRRTESVETLMRTTTIDRFRTDFGLVDVALDRHLDSSFSGNFDLTTTTGTQAIVANGVMLGIDPRYARLAMGEDYFLTHVGVDSDGYGAFLGVEGGLQVDNPIALFGASNCLGT